MLDSHDNTNPMEPLQARVVGGRLVLNVPTTLPEGLILDLVVEDPGDDLDGRERAHLDDAIKRALAEFESGQATPANDFLDRLRGDESRASDPSAPGSGDPHSGQP